MDTWRPASLLHELGLRLQRLRLQRPRLHHVRSLRVGRVLRRLEGGRRLLRQVDGGRA